MKQNTKPLFFVPNPLCSKGLSQETKYSTLLYELFSAEVGPTLLAMILMLFIDIVMHIRESTLFEIAAGRNTEVLYFYFGGSIPIFLCFLLLFFCFCSNLFMYVSTGYISSFRDWMQLYLEI